MKHYDVIIIGGSYSGLAASMALGRASKNVLIIDDVNPCNKQTPYSHNFLTQDGNPPFIIASRAKEQVEKYPTVSFLNDTVISCSKITDGFKVITQGKLEAAASKLIFATGIRDILPDIKGISECWGISVLHCPFCHGYEVKNETTGIIGNGESGFEMIKLISNWTKDLTLYTNGLSTLTYEQTELLLKHRIKIDERKIAEVIHSSGLSKSIRFTNNELADVTAIYLKAPFEQHSKVPAMLGCQLNDEGYLVTNQLQETTTDGIYACGDNSSKMRTVANAVGTGTTAGISASKSVILEEFYR